MNRKPTPLRRRMLLDPKSVRAWTDAFIRRDDAAEPVPLDIIVQRYLQDTNSVLLAQEAEAMAALRSIMAEALMRAWTISVDSNGLVHGAACLELKHHGGKICLTIPSATILNSASGFNEKDLTTRGSITGGTACPFSCSYCSTPSMMDRSSHTRILRVLDVKHADAFMRRLDPVDTLRMQLTDKNGHPRFKNDHGVVILSPIVDPLANIDLLEESLQMILLVMELTGWDVRILTKSMLIKKLARRIPEKYRRRVIYGLSIGILDANLAQVVEKLTSPPKLRIEAYRELQQMDLRTYSMHCPILPQSDYPAYAERLAASMNWQADELIWGEALNLRGDSIKKTIAALEFAEFRKEAGLLSAVSGSRVLWETQYNRPLFEALAAVCPPGKLRCSAAATAVPWCLVMRNRPKATTHESRKHNAGDLVTRVQYSRSIASLTRCARPWAPRFGLAT